MWRSDCNVGRRPGLVLALAVISAVGCADEGRGGGSAADASLDDGVLDARPRPDFAPPDDFGVADMGFSGAFSTEPPIYRLTLLHTNDGQSALLPQGDDEDGTGAGGIGRFITVLERLKAQVVQGPNVGLLTVSSGDNFIAGPVFGASLLNGPPFYGAVGLSYGAFDAMTLGNHDFDFGPNVLAQFISSFDPPVRFLSANLGFGDEPALAALEAEGLINDAVVIRTGDSDVGVIGLTTPTLAVRSSPGAVTVSPVTEVAQSVIDGLRNRGVDKIILVSHQASLDEEIALVGALTDVDILVAGGSDDLLASDDDAIHPGDVAVDAYPLLARDANGRPVPVVTTAGRYRYVGRLVVDFDLQGRVTGVVDDPEVPESSEDAQSGPVRVIGANFADAAEPHPEVVERVERKVEEAIDGLAAEQIGFSQVPLHGRRSDLRRKETNLGDVVADALRWQATDFVFGTDLPEPDIALMNGGGVRNNSIIPPGVLTELHTYQILPFASFVTVVSEVDRATLKALLENAVSEVDNGAGRFAQISGFSFTWDIDQPARFVDGQRTVIEPGQRVRSAQLDDGTPLIADGAVVEGPALTIATIDFLARGGDGYPFPPTAQSTAISYQTALRNFIGGALEGEIGPENYPVEGTGRITALE